MSTLRASLTLPFLLLAACGDDSTAGTTGDGGGPTTSAATTGSTQPSSTASSTSSAGSTGSTSTSTGDGGSGAGGDPSGTGGTGGEPSGTGGDPSGTGGDPTGSGGSGSGGGTAICDDVEPAEARIDACTALAEAQCDFYAACEIPAYLLIGGDREQCIALTFAGCADQGNVVEDDYLVCLADLATQFDQAPCGQLRGYDYPASCLHVGHLADGEPCFSDLECRNGLCLVEGSACGTCGSLVDEGDACDIDEVCPRPLSCIEGECAAPAVDGTPCDSARDCAGLACEGGACATGSYVGLGELCGGLAACDPSAELVCDDTGTCVANPTPEPGLLGEECVEHDVDYFGFILGADLCEAGTRCSAGTCVEAALPGEACPEGDGVCAASTCTDGVCVPYDPNVCACGD